MRTTTGGRMSDPEHPEGADVYGPETYGERIAERYDFLYPEADEGSTDFLAQLASGGRVLELAIGSGRMALPLVELGLEVHGIDASPEMIARLRSKPGGDTVHVTVGDFADVDVDGSFALVVVSFNTFFCLLTQEAQVACFRNVAAHLDADGVFVIQAFVPDLARFDHDQRVETRMVGTRHALLYLSEHDPASQRVSSQLVELMETGIRMYPVELRYAWPSELDLMARLAGLELRERLEDWDGKPFTSTSQSHVSVYARSPR
jgi:SAM-dependent methyltransferase